MPDPTQDPEGKNPAAFRMNQVGREQPAPEVLAAKVDPAVRRRAFILSALAAALLLSVIVYTIVTNRSGSAPVDRTRSFDPPTNQGPGL